jgi:Uma2 family endonuclease
LKKIGALVGFLSKKTYFCTNYSNVIKMVLIKSVTIPKMVSLDAYFRAEEKSLTKNEYHNGIILPMAGGKLKHNRLAQKAASLMDAFIDSENLDYIVSNSDTKIRIENFNKVVYPDAVVICEIPQYFNQREDIITNPTLIVEVLSVSTQRQDHTTKFELYRTLPSFREYILIYQDRYHVVVWTKQDNGAWLPVDYIGINAVAILHSLHDYELPMTRLYRGIQFT